ncbi:ATP-dependent RNA helicase DDX1-like [Convolutriloba macropyga]|uniref:ATP-dependent RNA helicase DDX1-like n=1 Tax=Convolutriloba macropyga TaxID=536237 RepID=UPI003F51D692
MSAFSTEFGVCDEVEKALQTLEWMLPTDVQSEACPLILGGGDVLMAAETGSGKTGAFCIPVVQIVLETLREKRDGVKPSTSKPAGGTKMAMNIWDRSPQFAISPDGLLCQSREQKVWQGSRATYGVANQGKWYYEATITDEGLCRVGFSTSKAALGDLGCDNQGFGFGGTGKKSFCRQFDDYGEPFGLSDTIGCYLDLDSASIKYSKNGKVFSKAFGIPPDMLHNTTIFPACTLKNAELKFNFGDEPFKYPPGNSFSGFAGADPKYLIKSLAAPEKSASSQSRKRQNCPQALILEPSKELAEQTHNCINTLKQYCKDPAIRALCCVGGANIRDQIEALESGIDIVTGTPGRLGDLISNEKLDVRDVRFFILDEADGLLQQQHGDLIQTIWKKIPQVTADNKRLQVVVCSATLHSREVKQLADKIMHFPVWVDLKGQDSVPDTVHNVVCMVDPTKDLSWQSSSAMITTDGVHRVEGVRAGTHSPEGLSEAVKILKGIYVVNAIKKHQMDQAIIFCRTRLDCDNMERFLWSQGGGRNRNNAFACACLHGDKRNDRAINLEKFKKKEIKFLICTDVAARGLDVSGMPFMISVTMPPSEEKQTYVHRIGRVGRAERMGLAIALVSRFKEKVWYHQCPSRGKNCSNINLTDHGGCCKWYDETTYLGEIEEHLGTTIPQINPDMHVAADEFAGKVTYGQKITNMKSNYNNHVSQLAPAVRELADMETMAQRSFLSLLYQGKSGLKSDIF